MQEIEARLARLEREVRRWRVAAGAVLVVATSALVVAAQSPHQVPNVLQVDTISAKRFSLMVDGKERARLGVDDQGPDNVIPGLFLYRKAGAAEPSDCARFVVFGQNDEPELVLKNRTGEFQAWLRAETSGGASLDLCDERGKATKTLSSARD
jgi:hypothetical protein